jgi:hypothetical protein
VTERGRVTAATAMEAAMKASDGKEGEGEGDSGGGRATVTRVEGKRGRWREMLRAARAMATATRVGTKRTRVSKRATNHFILNWNKMFDLHT